MTSVRIWGPGVGAVVVLVATGAWARGSTGEVDAGLWDAVRPAIEARLTAQAADEEGYGEAALGARWFCAADPLDLRQDDGRVRAGVDTLCMEYGVRDGSLQECSGSHYPQVMRLERDPHGGYRVVSQEEPPDGADYASWQEDHFSVLAEYRLDGSADPSGLESAARAHFGLPADAPVGDC
ncbi:hypothetical protein [Streptomyces phaeofaciens]|uniref:hypothetical protein n=1 Tax=Streptomyces phaeofaciens TaxID=68254 RepID=UPI0036D1AD99